MRNRFLRILLILILLISVFPISVTPVFADKLDDKLIIRDDNYELVMDYDPNNHVLVSNTRDSSDGAVEHFKSIGIEFSCEEQEGGEYAAVVLIGSGTTLRYGEDPTLIETEMPLIIKKSSSISEENTANLFFTGEYGEYSDDNRICATAIDCSSTLTIDGVNITFYNELKDNTYLRDEEEFVGIDAYNNVTIKNSNITFYGTIFIDGSNNYSGILIDNSTINASIKYPTSNVENVETFDYYDYHGALVQAHEFFVKNKSSIEVKANIPDISRYPNPTEEQSKFITNGIVEADAVVIEDNSSLKIEESNHHYLCGIATDYLSVSGAALIIKGCINSIHYQPLSGREEEEKPTILPDHTSGIHFYDAHYELESLLSNINMKKDTRPIPLPGFTIYKHISIKYENTFDYMTVTGNQNDLNDLQTPAGNEEIIGIDGFGSILLVEPNQLSGYLDSIYSLKYTDEQTINKDSYHAECDLSDEQNKIAMLQNAKSIGIISEIEPTLEGPRIEIYTHDHWGVVTDEGPYDGDGYMFPEFNVDYKNNTFSVEVLSDFTFERQPGDRFDSFITCADANLEFVGDKKLTFKINYDSSEIPTSINCFNLPTNKNITISGKSKDKKLLIDVVEGYNGLSATNSSYLFNSKQLLKFEEKNEELSGNDYSLRLINVSITDKSYSPLIRVDNMLTYITDSNIDYTFNDVPNKFYSNNLNDRRKEIMFDAINSSSGIYIERSNINLVGNENLYSQNVKAVLTENIYSKGKAEPISSGIRALGGVYIKDCNGTNGVKINTFDHGIYSQAVIIENSNLNVATNVGGVVGVQSCQIKMTNDGLSLFVTTNQTPDIESKIFSAIYTTQDKSSIFTLPNDIEIYDKDNNKIDLANLDSILSIQVKTKEIKPTPTPTPDPEPTPTPIPSPKNTYTVPKTGIK